MPGDNVSKASNIGREAAVLQARKKLYEDCGLKDSPEYNRISTQLQNLLSGATTENLIQMEANQEAQVGSEKFYSIERQLRDQDLGVDFQQTVQGGDPSAENSANYRKPNDELRHLATEAGVIRTGLEQFDTRKEAKAYGFDHARSAARQARRVISHIDSNDFQTIEHVYTSKDAYKAAMDKAIAGKSGAAKRAAKDDFEKHNKYVDGKSLEGLKKMSADAKQAIEEATKNVAKDSDDAKKLYDEAVQIKAQALKETDATKRAQLEQLAETKQKDMMACLGRIQEAAVTYGRNCYRAFMFEGEDGKELNGEMNVANYQMAMLQYSGSDYNANMDERRNVRDAIRSQDKGETGVKGKWRSFHATKDMFNAAGIDTDNKIFLKAAGGAIAGASLGAIESFFMGALPINISNAISNTKETTSAISSFKAILRLNGDKGNVGNLDSKIPDENADIDPFGHEQNQTSRIPGQPTEVPADDLDDMFKSVEEGMKQEAQAIADGLPSNEELSKMTPSQLDEYHAAHPEDKRVDIEKDSSSNTSSDTSYGDYDKGWDASRGWDALKSPAGITNMALKAITGAIIAGRAGHRDELRGHTPEEVLENTNSWQLVRKGVAQDVLKMVLDTNKFPESGRGGITRAEKMVFLMMAIGENGKRANKEEMITLIPTLEALKKHREEEYDRRPPEPTPTTAPCPTVTITSVVTVTTPPVPDCDLDIKLEQEVQERKYTEIAVMPYAGPWHHTLLYDVVDADGNRRELTAAERKTLTDALKQQGTEDGIHEEKSGNRVTKRFLADEITIGGITFKLKTDAVERSRHIRGQSGGINPDYKDVRTKIINNKFYVVDCNDNIKGGPYATQAEAEAAKKRLKGS